MNLPPNVSEEVAKAFKEIRDHLKFTEKTAQGLIIDSTGNTAWEEPEEEYQARMNELFYEVK